MLFLLVFLFYFAARISFFFIPVYLNNLGFNSFEIGVLIALSSVAAFISFFPSGFVNDSNSVKKPLFFSFILLALFYFGLTVFNSFFLFLLLFLIGGVGLKVGVNSLKNYFLKNAEPGFEGQTMGFYQLIVILGVFFGVLFVGFVVPLIDFPIVLRFVSFLFIGLIFFLFFFKEVKTSNVRISEYKDDFLKKNVLFFSLILFLFTLHWGAESTSYALFLKNYFNLDLFFSSLYMAFPLLFLGFSAFLFGKKIDAKKIDFANVFLIGVFVSGLTHVLMVLQPVQVSFLMRCIHEFGDGLAQIGFFFWIFKAFDFKRLAGNASLIMTVTVFGEIIGSIIFSNIGGLFGYEFAFIGSGLTSILAAILFLIYMRKYKHS